MEAQEIKIKSLTEEFLGKFSTNTHEIKLRSADFISCSFVHERRTSKGIIGATTTRLPVNPNLPTIRSCVRANLDHSFFSYHVHI
jgi:hypothetical protein